MPKLYVLEVRWPVGQPLWAAHTTDDSASVSPSPETARKFSTAADAEIFKEKMAGKFWGAEVEVKVFAA